MAHFDSNDDCDFETPPEETARRIILVLAAVVGAFVVWLFLG